MGESAIGHVQGREVLTWKSRESVKFDTKRFKESYPSVYSDFSTKVSTRYFTVK